MKLPSQLDSTVQLANAGDWDAIRFRLGNQIPPVIEFSSLLLERVDERLAYERDHALKDMQQGGWLFFTIVSIAALLTLLMAVALGWFVVQRITVPLSELKHGAEALARGDFHHRVSVCGDDELAVLGKAFDHAAQRLQQLYEDLWRSEHSLRDVINTVPAQAWSALPDGDVDFVNQRRQQFTGLPAEDALRWNWDAVVHPDDRTKFVADWRAALNSGQPMETEVRVRRADGQYRCLLVRNVPLRDEHGKILKWYGISTDIDDRKRAEQEREHRAVLHLGGNSFTLSWARPPVADSSHGPTSSDHDARTSSDLGGSANEGAVAWSTAILGSPYYYCSTLPIGHRRADGEGPDAPRIMLPGRYQHISHMAHPFYVYARIAIRNVAWG